MTDSKHEEDRRAALVAYLSSGHRGRQPQSQAAIAGMGLAGLTSQSAVSRAFNRAVQLGYLREAAPLLEVDRLRADNVFEHVEYLDNMVELKERLVATAEVEGWLRVPVVHGIPVRLDLKEPIEKRRRLTQAFFGFAGAIVYGLVRDCRRVGISWGETVSNLVSALDDHVAALPTRPKTSYLVGVAPLVGEPPAGVTSEFSATLLAERLLRALPHDPRAVERLTLRYVHSFVSDDLARHYNSHDLLAGTQRALEYYRAVSSYKKIFGSGKDDDSVPFVQLLDAIITSLSWDGVPWGIHTQESEEDGGIPSSKKSYMLPSDADVVTAVEELAIGDICGVLLPSEDGNRERLDDLQSRWTGIQPSQLGRLAAKAAERNQPGVIVVAFGVEKVKTTLAALRSGYVNHLVIGERLAQGLVNALPGAPLPSIDQGMKTRK